MTHEQAAVLIEIMRELEAKVGTLNDAGLDDFGDMLQDIGYKIIEEITDNFDPDEADTLFGYYSAQ